MNEDVNQPEQAFPAGAEAPNEFAVSGYEEPPVPYFPLPGASQEPLVEQTSPAPIADSQGADTPSSSSSADTAAVPPRRGSGKWGMALLLSFLIAGLVFVVLALYPLIIGGVLLLGLLVVALVYVVTTIYNYSSIGATFFSTFILIVLVFVLLTAPDIPFWKASLLVPIWFGLVIAALVIPEAYVHRQLKRNGVITDGYITDRGQLYTGRGGPHYELEYRYEYNGITYSSKEFVAESFHRTAQVGDRVDVLCLPEHPTIARLYDRRSDRFISDKRGKRPGAVV